RRASRREIAAALRQVRDARELTWAGWAHAAGVSAAMIHCWKRGEATPGKGERQRLAEAAGAPIAALKPENHARTGMVTPLTRFLAQHGLHFKSVNTKTVPACVFRLPKSQLALFLRTLFTCAGSIFVSRNGQPGICYSTINRRLAAEIQHLLLR